MKTRLAVLLATALFTTSFAGNPPPFLWIRQIGGTGDDWPGWASLAVDRAGNCLVAGSFTSTINFAGTNLPSAGGNDIFVAKFNPAGALQWVRQAGGTGDDTASGIAADSSGNVYVAGVFSSTATFGPTNLVSRGAHDLFLAKYDANGQLLWVRQGGGTMDDTSPHQGVAVDLFDNCYLAAAFKGTATFESITLTSAGVGDICLAKYANTGALLWVRQAGGTNDDWANNVAVDKAGNCLITGGFSDKAAFGDTNIMGAGSVDCYVAKYDAGGELQWVRTAGSTSNYTEGHNLAVDSDGNCFVNGEFGGAITFGSIKAQAASTGYQDGFVAAYDSAGQFLWVQRFGGSSTDWGAGNAVDGSGNYYLAGIFSTSATFGLTTLLSTGSVDAFLAKFTKLGGVEWTLRAGGTGVDGGLGVAVDGVGNIYWTGVFTTDAAIGGTNFSSAGGFDFFVSKLGYATQTNSNFSINMYAGLSIEGSVGSSIRVECLPQFGPTNDWETLTNFLLPSSPFLFIDTASPSHPTRFYRLLQTP